ncbi:MAG: 3-deoxy-manno-octulosonate cytidylyltransferase [Elusimicrobia bacterium]|nr:3-deoxy-manno-octulosonate cytidylyltransferase [Elusimicrobiota bacterium]
MNVLGVIPARFAAQRFPGKPLASIAGRPMIWWVWNAAQKALPRVVVATDDRRIVETVRRFGGEAMLTSDQCRSGTDRVAEVARKIKAGLYLNIQGDEPLMTARTLWKVLALHADRSVCLGTVATVLTPLDWIDPNAVKVLVDKRGDSLYFSRSPLPYFRDGAPKAPPPNKLLFKHLGVYSYRPETLRAFVRWPAGFFETAEKLEQLRALENGVRIRVAVTPDDSIGVDLPGNVARVEKILKRRGTAS